MFFDRLTKTIKDSIVKTSGDDLRLIDEAFSEIDNRKGKFDEFERIFEAEFSSEKIEEFKRFNRASVYVPAVRDAINIIAGQFISAFFSGKSPIEFSGKEKDKIAELNSLIKQELYRAKPMTELQSVFLNTLVYGFGCAMIRWDEKEKIPVTTCLPIDSFALDPRATNIKDAKYCCYRQSMSVMDAKELYPQAEISGSDYERVEVKEIYKLEYLKVENKKIKVWRIKTFIERHEVKQDYTIRLPFFYGYAIKGLVKRKTDPNDKGISYFGTSLVSLLKNYQEEVNKKRNQKLQSDDNKVNPRVVYKNDFPFEILQMGAGSAKRTSDLDSFRFIDNGNSAVSVEQDIENLKSEMRQAAGITSVNMGVTGASDRRSASALQIIAASSGVRIETMIQTVLETLFDNWAKGFVEEIRFRKGSFLLEMVDTSVMKINFGSQVAIAARIQDLMEVYRISSSSGGLISADLTQSVLYELLSLLLGGDYDPSRFFQKQQTPQSYGGL